jgi:serine/threonine protein kinase
MIVTKKMKNGNLHNLILNQKKKDEYLTGDCKWHLVKEIYKPLYHLWSMDRISHNNIKPQNILLDDNLESLVLCDFAHSTKISEKLKKQFGTATFMAPEINEFT